MVNQSEQKKVVLASGVFDLLHLGHVKFLEEAKKAGGPHAQLVVVIARDSTVEKAKGRKPIMPENQRRALVESLRVVDRAVLGYENLDIGEVIENIRPDVIALGYDQEDVMKQVLDYVNKKNKTNVKVVRIGKFGEKPLDSSSRIKKEIIEKRERLSYAESKFGHSQ
jgi:FAD synthetase